MDNSSSTLKEYNSRFRKKENNKPEEKDPERLKQEKLERERESLLKKYYKK